MSGTFSPPNDPAEVELSSENGATLVSRAHSGKTQRRRRGGHTWRIRYTFAPQSRADYSDILGFLIDQDGQYETFSLILPSVIGAKRGTWAGTPLVKGASETDTPVDVDGFTAGATVKRMDFFKFAGHSKVYAVATDGTASAGGEIALAFKPHLIATPADNEAITHANVPFTVALATDVTSIVVRPPVLGTISVDFVEVW